MKWLSVLTDRGLILLSVFLLVCCVISITLNCYQFVKCDKRGVMNEDQINSLIKDYQNWPSQTQLFGNNLDCYSYNPEFYNGLFK